LEVVFIKFPYNSEFVSKVKSIQGTRWSQSKRCWYIQKEIFNLNLFFELFGREIYLDYSALKVPDQGEKEKLPLKESKSPNPEAAIPQAYIDLLDQRRYSKSTKVTYRNYFSKFLIYFKYKKPENISVDEINAYLLELIRKDKISVSQQNQRINAIKFYFEKVLGREKMYFNIKRPRKKKSLPNTLSTKEIRLIIDVTENLKHKAIISMLYSGGLRRSELCNLEIKDIFSDTMQVKIRESKGFKDRYVNLSRITLDLLRDYFRQYKPKKYLFEGQQNGKKYSCESVLKVVRGAGLKAGINRRVTPHMLRHSFATHHLEKGTDIRYIQEFLGHNSSKTTEIYTHVAKTDTNKFINPLDEIYNYEEQGTHT
jgi:integrase/recombinase XerD